MLWTDCIVSLTKSICHFCRAVQCRNVLEISAFFSCSASSRAIQVSDSLNTVYVKDDADVEVHVSNGVASGITVTLSVGDHQSLGGQNQFYEYLLHVSSTNTL